MPANSQSTVSSHSNQHSPASFLNDTGVLGVSPLRGKVTPLVPLKQSRYAISPEVKSMTIAAGFRCLDGIVIGADDEVEEGTVTHPGQKIMCLYANTGRIVATGAGNMDEVWHWSEALQESFLKDSDGSNQSMRSAIREMSTNKRYLQAVGRCRQEKNPFVMIFGLRSGNGETDLVQLKDEKLQTVTEYVAVGTGWETLRFFADWLYKPTLRIKSFRSIAAQLFRAAKGHNVGCGGTTAIHGLYNGGRAEIEPQINFSSDADLLWGLYDLFPPVIHACFDSTISRDEFGNRLRAFAQGIQDIRVGSEGNEEMLEFLKGHLQRVKEARSTQQSPTRDPSDQQPLPE